jgi:hypothetical protein
MLLHLVLLRFDDPADADEAEQRMRALLGRIDVLRHLDVGRNVVESDRAYDLGIYAEFDSVDDLETYQRHPEHLPVAEFIRARRSAVAAVDFYR